MRGKQIGNRCKCEEQQLKMLRHSERKRRQGEGKRREHVPAVTNERVVKLDYHYHTH